jgi:hypothetical protein
MKHIWKPILNISLALVMVAGSLAWFTPAQLVRAEGIWYVTPGGNDSNNCVTPGTPCATIQAAINKTVSGGSVYVTIGSFTDAVYINRSVSLFGGWNLAFTQQNGITILDGGHDHIPVAINNVPAPSVIIDRFLIQNGSSPSWGGGIFNGGILTLQNSLVMHNTSAWQGGGIYNYGNGGSLTIINSSISHNTAVSGGGGIAQYGAPLTITNSTISNNSAQMGGGIYAYYGMNIDLNYVTIAFNTATSGGGGITTLENYMGGPTIKSSLLANNEGWLASPDCNSSLNSLGYNLITDITDCTILGNLTGNLIGIDPQLLSFIEAGGYYALAPFSPAIDATNDASCPPTDQRGLHRPQGAHCDIGAIEYLAKGLIFLPFINNGDPTH